MAWSTVLLTDLTGEQVGEVANPYERTISKRHRQLATVHFSLRLNDPLVDRLLDGDVLVELFNDELDPVDPQFVGEVTDAEEIVTAASKRVGITASDATYRLAQRLLGKSPTGYKKDIPTDRGAVIAELVNAANTENDTGVRMGTVEASSSDYIGPWTYKPISEALAELSAALDGYDWRMNPVHPTPDATGLQIGELEIRKVMGLERPDAIFAYSNDEDDRGNIKGYRRAITKQGMLNTGYSLPPGFPDTPEGKVQTWFDGPSRAKWNWREGVVPGDITVDALRLKLVQEHVAVRRNPRETIVIDSPLPESREGPEVPRYGLDYEVGDLIPFRATVDGATRVDALFRVYGVDLALDDAGNETPTLTLQPETS